MRLCAPPESARKRSPPTAPSAGVGVLSSPRAAPFLVETTTPGGTVHGQYRAMGSRVHYLMEVAGGKEPQELSDQETALMRYAVTTAGDTHAIITSLQGLLAHPLPPDSYEHLYHDTLNLVARVKVWEVLLAHHGQHPVLNSHLELCLVGELSDGRAQLVLREKWASPDELDLFQDLRSVYGQYRAVHAGAYILSQVRPHSPEIQEIFHGLVTPASRDITFHDWKVRAVATLDGACRI